MIRKALLAVGLGCLLAPAAFAQASGELPAPKAAPKAAPRRPMRVLPGADVELKTKDGWTLAARYLPAKAQGLPVFILLHETGGRKENWYFLAKTMERKGIGFLALDFRGHGGSQSPPPGEPPNWRKFSPPTKSANPWNSLTLDVDAAAEYLQSQGLAISSIAAGGADVGSSIALKWAAVHPAVPMVFMLSPGMSYREVLTVNAIRAYGKRPILMMVGADDPRSPRETAILYEFAKRSAGLENTTLITAEREHGTRILVVNKGIVGRIVDWIYNPIAQPEPPQASTAAAPGTQAPLPTDQELNVAPPAEGENPPAEGEPLPGPSETLR